MGLITQSYPDSKTSGQVREILKYLFYVFSNFICVSSFKRGNVDLLHLLNVSTGATVKDILYMINYISQILIQFRSMTYKLTVSPALMELGLRPSESRIFKMLILKKLLQKNTERWQVVVHPRPLSQSLGSCPLNP